MGPGWRWRGGLGGGRCGGGGGLLFVLLWEGRVKRRFPCVVMVFEGMGGGGKSGGIGVCEIKV